MPRNPFERTVRNIYDLAADPHPREGDFPLPDPVRPGEFDDRSIESVREHIRERTGRRIGRFIPHPFLAQVASAQIIPSQPERFYLIIVNNSAVNRMFVGFDYEPNVLNGLILETNLGFYEPWIVPSNSIHIAAAGANTAGIILLALA